MPFGVSLPRTIGSSLWTNRPYSHLASAPEEPDVELQPLSIGTPSHVKELHDRIDSLRSAIASELTHSHCHIDPSSEWADVQETQSCGYRTYLPQANMALSTLSALAEPEPCHGQTRSRFWRRASAGGLTEDELQVYDRAAHRLDRTGRRIQSRPNSNFSARLGDSLRDIAFLTHLVVLDGLHSDDGQGSMQHADALLWSFVNANCHESWLGPVDLRRGRAALSPTSQVRETKLPCTTSGCDCFQTPDTLRLQNQRSVRATLTDTASGAAGMSEMERTLLSTALEHSVSDLSQKWGFRVDEVLDDHRET